MNTPPVFYNIEKLLPWLERRTPLITPNQRLAGHIKYAWGRYLHQQGVQSWETPEVYSLSQWWQHCEQQLNPWFEAEKQVLNDSEQLELWERCVRETPDSGDLLQPRSAARLARTAYQQLLSWQLDWRDGPAARHFQYATDAELFVQWAQRFEKYCREHACTVPEQELLHWAGKCPRQTLVLVEFDQLPPLPRAALALQAAELIEHSNPRLAAQCLLQPCGNWEDELTTAADWACAQLAQQPRQRIAILLNDVAAWRPRLERLLRERLQPQAEPWAELPVNFSAGASLGGTPMIRTALALLSLLEGDTEVDQLTPLLQSRYRAAAEPEEEARMLRSIYRRGRSLLNIGGLRQYSSRQSLGKALRVLGRERELQREQLPSEWARRLPWCLQQLGWPGEQPHDSTEYQVHERWRKTLDVFAGLDKVSRPLSFSGAVQLLKEVCADTRFQVQTANSSLQVLGFLDAAGMEFDQLWICGADSNQWPPRPAPNPFIPVALQRQAGLPNADSDRQIEFSTRMLERFRGSCRTLVASYAELKDDAEQGPSTLLADFARLDRAPPAAKPWASERWRAAGAAQIQVLEDQVAPPASAQELKQVRSSVLEDQSLCGFRAFARQRLQVQALPELGEGLSAAERGLLLHRALEHLWGHLQNSRQLAATTEQHPDMIAEAVNSAIKDFNKPRQRSKPGRATPRVRGRGEADRAMLQLERERLQDLLAQWLQIELKRSEFEVVAREARREIKIGKLQLKLRLDRVDQLTDGKLLVVDYKSGNAEIGYWFGERPRQPQLPLYACVTGADCSGASFALVRGDEPVYKGLSASPEGDGISDDFRRVKDADINSWEDMQRRWQSVLENLAQAFVDGNAAVDPPDTRVSCTWCGLQALCRIGEQEAAGDV